VGEERWDGENGKALVFCPTGAVCRDPLLSLGDAFPLVVGKKSMRARGGSTGLKMEIRDATSHVERSENGKITRVVPDNSTRRDSGEVVSSRSVGGVGGRKWTTRSETTACSWGFTRPAASGTRISQEVRLGKRMNRGSERKSALYCPRIPGERAH